MSKLHKRRPKCAFPDCTNMAKPYKHKDGREGHRKYCNRHSASRNRVEDVAKLPDKLRVSNAQTVETKRAAKIANVLKFIRAGTGIYKACEAVGEAYGTFLKWRNDDDDGEELEHDVQLAIAESYERSVDLVEKALFTQAKDCEGPPSAKYYVLGNRRPDKWKDVRKIEVAGDKNAPLKVSIVKYSKKDADKKSTPDGD
jgi:hypothetical protein